MASSDYILVTPVKNEQLFLPIVAESVVSQTILPKLWIIVDDGSEDRTPAIITDLYKKYSWIECKRLDQHPRDLYFHYSYVCRCGFEYAMERARLLGIEYNFIGLLDADTQLENNYFKSLIDELMKDHTLGIVSGDIFDTIDGKVAVTDHGYLPRGTGRLWTKKCFLDTDGYIIEAAAHAISNIKAILRGYKVSRITFAKGVQLRETRSAEGLWITYIKDGWLAYYLGKPLVLVILNSLYSCIRKPYYLGIPYFWGFFKALITRSKRIQDQEIIDYYRKKRMQEITKNIKKRINKPS